MEVRSCQDLVVWQKAMDLATLCYRVTKAFPRDELFGMTSQIRRSSSSIPANIAEGQARAHTREFLHFLSIARGSAKELETHLLLCQRVGLLDAATASPALGLVDEVCRMLARLRAALEAKL